MGGGEPPRGFLGRSAARGAPPSNTHGSCDPAGVAGSGAVRTSTSTCGMGPTETQVPGATELNISARTAQGAQGRSGWPSRLLPRPTRLWLCGSAQPPDPRVVQTLEGHRGLRSVPWQPGGAHCVARGLVGGAGESLAKGSTSLRTPQHPALAPAACAELSGSRADGQTWSSGQWDTRHRPGVPLSLSLGSHHPATPECPPLCRDPLRSTSRQPAPPPTKGQLVEPELWADRTLSTA